MVKVIHYDGCSKSRGILEYLDEHGTPFEIIDIKASPLSEDEIRTLLKKLGLSATEIVRTNEKMYMEHFAGKELSEDEWIGILSSHPELIQRPILIKGPVAVVGRPVENVALFLEG